MQGLAFRCANLFMVASSAAFEASSLISSSKVLLVAEPSPSERRETSRRQSRSDRASRRSGTETGVKGESTRAPALLGASMSWFEP
jgi:hypothetical protein